MFSDIGNIFITLCLPKDKNLQNQILLSNLNKTNIN
jgi:hypothetical protein